MAYDEDDDDDDDDDDALLLVVVVVVQHEPLTQQRPVGHSVVENCTTLHRSNDHLQRCSNKGVKQNT
jgi:hypothetical protein